MTEETGSGVFMYGPPDEIEELTADTADEAIEEIVTGTFPLLETVRMGKWERQTVRIDRAWLLGDIMERLEEEYGDQVSGGVFGPTDAMIEAANNLVLQIQKSSGRAPGISPIALVEDVLTKLLVKLIPEPSDAMKESVERFRQVILADYIPWTHDLVEEWDVNVEEWLAAHPDVKIERTEWD